jgi:hypothetical protein
MDTMQTYNGKHDLAILYNTEQLGLYPLAQALYCINGLNYEQVYNNTQ